MRDTRIVGGQSTRRIKKGRGKWSCTAFGREGAGEIFFSVFSYVIGGYTEDRQPNPSQRLTVFTGPDYFDNEDAA